MSFGSRETSIDRGEPFNLYQFKYGSRNQDVHCYTDAEGDVAAFGRIFKSIPIRRSSINSSGTTDKTTLTVEMPRTELLPAMFLVYPPSYTVALTIWQGHVGAPEDDIRVNWSGIVLSCARVGALEAKVSCEPVTVSMQRIGLRRNYQYMCPHALYGPQCRANKAAASSNRTLHAAAGRFVTITEDLGVSPEYYGGMVEWDTPDGRREYRTILSVQTQAGRTVFVINGLAHNLPTDNVVTIVKGCRHLMEDCSGVHNNIHNFGGQPWIPTSNPLGRTTPFL